MTNVSVEADVTAAVDLIDLLSTALGSDAVLQFLGEKLHDYEADLFATTGHGQWAALDPSTIAGKGSGRVLVDQGNLLAQLTSGPLQLTGDSVTVYTDDVAAIMAQRGARGMPVRDPALPPTAADVEGWANDLLAQLLGGL